MLLVHTRPRAKYTTDLKHCILSMLVFKYPPYGERANPTYQASQEKVAKLESQEDATFTLMYEPLSAFRLHAKMLVTSVS
jgi:hypothetical protein